MRTPKNQRPVIGLVLPESKDSKLSPIFETAKLHSILHPAGLIALPGLLAVRIFTLSIAKPEWTNGQLIN